MFHFHNWVGFKIGRFPLVARLCTKCGCIDIGNCVYYDGSTYQKRLRGKDAINYLQKMHDYILNDKILTKKLTKHGFYLNRSDVYMDYENEERYMDLIQLISK